MWQIHPAAPDPPDGGREAGSCCSRKKTFPRAHIPYQPRAGGATPAMSPSGSVPYRGWDKGQACSIPGAPSSPRQVLNPKLGQAESSLGQGGNSSNPSALLALPLFPLSLLSPLALVAPGCFLLASSSQGPAAPIPAIPTAQLTALGKGSFPSSALPH